MVLGDSTLKRTHLMCLVHESTKHKNQIHKNPIWAHLEGLVGVGGHRHGSARHLVLHEAWLVGSYENKPTKLNTLYRTLLEPRPQEPKQRSLNTRTQPQEPKQRSLNTRTQPQEPKWKGLHRTQPRSSPLSWPRIRLYMLLSPNTLRKYQDAELTLYGEQ